MIKILSFIIIFTIQFLIEYFELRFKRCKKKFYLLLIIHHYIDGFLYYGPLFFNLPKIHIIISVITLSHWILNNNECELTNINNKLCNINKKYRFRDFIFRLGISKQFPNIHYYILSFWIIYNGYYLLK